MAPQSKAGKTLGLRALTKGLTLISLQRHWRGSNPELPDPRPVF